jgi:signal transduction histidine kinase
MKRRQLQPAGPLPWTVASGQDGAAYSRIVSVRGGHTRASQSHKALILVELLVVVPTILIGVVALQGTIGELTNAQFLELLFWAAIVVVVELLPVPTWGGLQISVSLPILLLVAFLYPPVAAGATAFISTWDPRELRREIPVLTALFNRCQVALSVVSASWVFHEIADLRASGTGVLILGAIAAATADYLVNSGLVTLFVCIKYRLPPNRVIRDLRIGRLSEFLVSYAGLGALGLVLSQLFLAVKFWSVPVYLLPLLFARQMFFRSRALEEAHKELQEREQVLRALSNRMAEERQDERAAIAAYLHDDLAQLLFRLSIQVDVTRRHLSAGRPEKAAESLEKIRNTKQETSDRVRALIRDLHRSPLGHAGLAEALQGFIAEAARDSGVRFHTNIAEVALPAPIALLVYHIAREGTMNALKHARASNMWVEVKEDRNNIELVLRDDGTGFDADAPGPEGHYGLAMMRERAGVGGGTFEVETAPGAGTKITVRFPTSLLRQREETSDAHEASSDTSDASRGSRDNDVSSEPSEESVPA